MGEIYFIENGRKRKGEECNCEQCGSLFIRRKLSYKRHGKPYKKIYCSKECSAKSQENKIKFTCNNCSLEFEASPSRLKNSRHGFYFCSAKCHNEARKVDSGSDMIRPIHYGSGYSNYRQKAGIENGCEVCGEKEIFKITVHHKDGNRKNGAKENLEVVCCNCHTVRHLKLINGIWTFDSSCLTPREVVAEFDKKVKERIGAMVQREDITMAS